MNLEKLKKKSELLEEKNDKKYPLLEKPEVTFSPPYQARLPTS